MIFPTYEVNFERSSFDDSIIASGEIKNDSSRDYNLAIFRMLLFSRNKLVGSGIIKVHEFKKGITKPFRAHIDATNVKPAAVDRFEIMIEGGY